LKSIYLFICMEGVDLQSATQEELIDLVKQLQQELRLARKQTVSTLGEIALAPRTENFWRPKIWKEDPSFDIEQRQRLLHTLDLDPYFYEHEDHKLLILCYDMFSSLGLIETFNIPVQNLHSFLLTLRDSYRRVPFHNFFHAFNVAQSLFYLFTTCKAGEKFGPVELLSGLIAAFCHDIDHPGVNNTFLCNAGTPLGLLYNDYSVLEQHHCHQAFQLLKRPECNILVNLSPEQYKLTRKYIVASILATDLANHGDFMTQFRAKLEKLAWDTFEDKKLILCCLVKCADISNEIRPSSIATKWANRVMTEFYAQSALEKEKGLPVSPHMDPATTTTASGQIGFISYLCLPFFTEMMKLFPLMKVCCDQMISNKEKWQTKIEEKN